MKNESEVRKQLKLYERILGEEVNAIRNFSAEAFRQKIQTLKWVLGES